MVQQGIKTRQGEDMGKLAIGIFSLALADAERKPTARNIPVITNALAFLYSQAHPFKQNRNFWRSFLEDTLSFDCDYKMGLKRSQRPAIE